MMLFLVLGISLTLLGYLLAGIFGGVVAYFVFGVFWYRTYYLSKPLLHRSPSSPFVLVLQWPVVALYDAYTSPKLQNHPERFRVLYGDTGQSKFVTSPTDHATFSTYEEAVAFARKVAAETGVDAAIFDFAEYGKAPFAGEPSSVMYRVSPRGDLIRTT